MDLSFVHSKSEVNDFEKIK
jgi:hypothetical protein